MLDLNFICEGVKKIAADASEAILQIYNEEKNFEVVQKSDESPLTIADKKSNQIICDGLLKLAPEIPIISEENKEIAYSKRKNFEYAWLVDPLDGTKEFIKRNGDFTVNIALLHLEKTILGVVYIPCTHEIYWAIKGQGAYVQSNGEVAQLKAPKFQMADEGLGVVCSRSHLNDKTANFIDKMNQPYKVSRGSSLKFLILAKGEAHVYPRLAPTMEWDTGAAQIILEEAGGCVISEATKKPLVYNKENLLNPHFIAYGNVQNN